MAGETRQDRQDRKRREAEERNARWNTLSRQQQLDSLIARGAGECAQAQRLSEELRKEMACGRP